MMDFLYDLCGQPFGWIMRLIYDWVDNYAFAILLFTIFTKLILFPISYKQQTPQECSGSIRKWKSCGRNIRMIRKRCRKSR